MFRCSCHVMSCDAHAMRCCCAVSICCVSMCVGWTVLPADIGRRTGATSRLAWGGGDYYTDDHVQGGIYTICNMTDTCAIWPCRVMEDGIKGPYGSLEYIKKHIPGDRITTLSHAWYWMTDATPHESLPMRETGTRQFIRVVTSQLTAWYAEHSTPNPLGIQPTAHIIHGNKFHKASEQA